MRSAWERDSGHRDKPKVKQKESEADYGCR
jgi:hypothetical protein